MRVCMISTGMMRPVIQSEKLLNNACVAVPAADARCDERMRPEEVNLPPKTFRRLALRQEPSRRRVLRNMTAGTMVAVGSTLGMEFVFPSVVVAQNPPT